MWDNYKLIIIGVVPIKKKNKFSLKKRNCNIKRHKSNELVNDACSLHQTELSPKVPLPMKKKILISRNPTEYQTKRKTRVYS